MFLRASFYLKHKEIEYHSPKIDQLSQNECRILIGELLSIKFQLWTREECLCASYHSLIWLRGRLHKPTLHCPGIHLDTPLMDSIWGEKSSSRGKVGFFLNVVISKDAKTAWELWSQPRRKCCILEAALAGSGTGKDSGGRTPHVDSHLVTKSRTFTWWCKEDNFS